LDPLKFFSINQECLACSLDWQHARLMPGSLVGIGSDQTSKKEKTKKNTSLTLAKQPP
jgi:glycine cleavage system pyridoxal-binding protein P